MKFNKETIKDSAIVIITIILGIFFVNMVSYQPTVELIEDIQKETPQSTKNNVKDFSTSKQGTFVGTIDGKQKVNDEKIELFNSVKIPGLNLVYYPNQKILTGGTPEMKIKEIIIFDGKVHQIVYSFKRYDKQRIFFDGVIIAESNFNSFPKHFTGLVTGYPDAYVSELFDEVKIS